MSTSHRSEGSALREELEKVWANLPGWGALAAVNHTSVGLRFIITGGVFFMIGGILAMLMRTQLALPEQNIVHARLYNQLFTMHGTIMMFLFAIPILEGLAVYLIPKMIGARDLVFPRIGAFGYYCYLFGGIIILFSLFMGVAPNSGWFMYTPLSSSTYAPGPGSDVWLLGVTFVEISALSAGIELVASILRSRTNGMTLGTMPIFCWYILGMGLMIVFGFPPLILASILLELERSVGMPFFSVEGGGDPLLWQHLFWLFGHPDVYIIFSARRRGGIYHFAGVRTAASGGLSLGRSVHYRYGIYQLRIVGPPHVYRGNPATGTGFLLRRQHVGGGAHGYSNFCLAGHPLDGKGYFGVTHVMDIGIFVHLCGRRSDRRNAGPGAIQLASSRYPLCGGPYADRKSVV